MPNLTVTPRGSLQVGKQTAFGTAATPSAQLYSTGTNFNHEKGQFRGESLRGGGDAAASRIRPARTFNRVTITRPTPLDINSVLLWLDAIFGTISGQPTTPASATNARQWLFEHDPTESNDPNLLTFICAERDDSDGTPNVFGVQAQDAICTQVVIASVDDDAPTVTETWMANRPMYGVSVTDQTPIEPVVFSSGLMSVTIDDSWAAMIGSSPTEAHEVVSMTATLSSGLTFPRQKTGATHLGHTAAPTRGVMMLDMGLGILVNTQATGLAREEYAHAEAEGTRYVNLRIIDDEIIDVGQPAVRTFELGGAMRHMATSLTERGGSDDGDRMLMNLVFRSVYAETTGGDARDIYAKVINDQASWL